VRIRCRNPNQKANLNVSYKANYDLGTANGKQEHSRAEGVAIGSAGELFARRLDAGVLECHQVVECQSGLQLHELQLQRQRQRRPGRQCWRPAPLGLNIDQPIMTVVNRVTDQRPPFANNNNPMMRTNTIMLSTTH